MRSAWIVVLAIACAGCSAELGGGGLVEVRSGNATGYTRIATSTRIGTPMNEKGLLIGGSLESRLEQRAEACTTKGLACAYNRDNGGTRWLGGVMVGYGKGPAMLDRRVGYEIYGEGGTPFRNGFFSNGSFYAGIGASIPILLGPIRSVDDLNESTWILTRRVEVVPQARFRVHVDDPGASAVPTIVRTDLTLGVSFRMRLMTDIF